ncbi:hypothetical protein [Paractinoplanes atraurantiacus]|uniref:Uncharacterized protein n=1 Tax=Paractinoplanes atraurantiacus TaxID=1036182 RepID=A0A285HKD9_9ACTN|nr:hypothetical protein [Actinoplanes atraurantiacus]SNY35246.1 hypothetical protein SAMN05421748_104404 [Actinoplanes atraurantiacus]
MTGSEVPRGVRVITLLAWLMVPAGVLLVCAGVLDLTWWASADAGRLTAVMTQIKTEYGVNEPALLRSGDGAVTLIVLGIAALSYGMLAPMIRRGRRGARGWAIGVGSAFFLVAMLGIGSDASQPSYLKDYYETLTWTTQTERIAEIKQLLYPAWYQWFEDFAQGLGALAALAVLVGLSWAAVAHADHFVGLRPGRPGAAATGGEPDEWDAALARIRNSGGIDAVRDDEGRGSSAAGRSGGGGGADGGGAVASAGRNGGRAAGGSMNGGGAGGVGAVGYDDDIDRLYRRPPRPNGNAAGGGTGPGDPEAGKGG